jgi:hypothetical protein
MTTSGTYDFSINRDQLITGALRLAGVIAQGETPSASQVSDAATTLNMMVKAWMADGMPLWAIRTVTITPVANQNTYTYDTPKLLKPLQAWNRQTSSQVDIPMRMISRQEYNILGNKSTTGNPIQLFFNPNLSTTEIKLFPTPDSTAAAQNVIYIVAQVPYQDFDSATDTPDFPQEWYEAIKYGLAVRLAGEYNIDIETRRTLVAEATAIKNEALSFGTEENSLYFQRDWRSW